MWKVLPVALVAFVACAAPPKGMRAETAARPPLVCGNALQQEHGPVFKAVVVSLAVIAFSATGAFAFQQAIDR